MEAWETTTSWHVWETTTSWHYWETTTSRQAWETTTSWQGWEIATSWQGWATASKRHAWSPWKKFRRSRRVSSKHRWPRPCWPDICFRNEGISSFGGGKAEQRAEERVLDDREFAEHLGSIHLDQAGEHLVPKLSCSPDEGNKLVVIQVPHPHAPSRLHP